MLLPAAARQQAGVAPCPFRPFIPSPHRCLVLVINPRNEVKRTPGPSRVADPLRALPLCGSLRAFTLHLEEEETGRDRQ